MSKDALLDFVHRLHYKIAELRRFGSGILLPKRRRKGRGMDEDNTPISWTPWLSQCLKCLGQRFPTCGPRRWARWSAGEFK
jgi:hypothetical protein